MYSGLTDPDLGGFFIISEGLDGGVCRNDNILVRDTKLIANVRVENSKIYSQRANYSITSTIYNWSREILPI